MFKHIKTCWLLTIGVLALLGAALFGTAGSASAAPLPPTPDTCPAVRVTSVEVVRTTTGPGLMVKGIKPHMDTRVHLVPEDVVYIRQPDFWNYFVLGCGGTGPTMKVPFTSIFRIDGPVGRCGIQVESFSILLGNNPDCEFTV